MNTSRFTKAYLLGLLCLLVVGAVIFHLNEKKISRELERDLSLRSNLMISQLSQHMVMAFGDIQSDLVFLSTNEHLNLLGKVGSDEHAKHSLEGLWTDFAAHRKRYDQIRFLDHNGTERVRVNYNRGHPAPVAKQKLQSKRHRYYFSEVIGLPPGTIYVSPLDLNIENKQIELPLKPMIRFATPVSNEQGNTIGVMLLNYLAQDLIDAFILNTSGFPGQALLFNSDGYPLVSPDSEKSWGFMFPDSPQTNLRTLHPTIWQQAKTQARGQLLTGEGLFTFDHVDPSGSEAPTDCASCLTLLLLTPEAQIDSMKRHETRALLPPFLFSLLLSALILGLLLWHWDRRRVQSAKIAALNDQIAFERDLFVSGPGTIIRQRNEIGWPVDYITANVKELLGYGPDDFLTQRITYASIIDPDYLPQFIRETQAADQAGKQTFKRSPYRVVDRQGNRKWVQDVCRAIRDRYGNVSHYYAHISDISALKQAERQLTLSRDYIQKVVDTLPDPTLVIDVSNYSLQLSNQSARSLYNGSREIPPEMTCYRLSHKRDTPCTGLNDPCPLHEVMLTGKPVSVRHKHFDHQGDLHYIDVRSTPLFDSTGRHIEQIVESHRDVTETVEMEKELQHLAITDRLTQVYNRLKFDDELKAQIEWAHMTDNTLGLIMFDLDHFKQVNDNHGHNAGDSVLKTTVRLVQQKIRKSDTLARWGGEEFMIITPLTDVFELKSISEALRSEIEDLTHQGIGQVTASFGGSVLRRDDTIVSLIKRVDTALYQSKQNGRNRCTIVE